MSLAWVAIGSSVLGAGASIYGANKASESAENAAQVSADAQSQALAYQQQVEAMPLGYRDAAMQGLGSQYGLTMDQSGNVVSDGSTIDQRVQSDPMYNGMLSAGESAIGRGASASGRLRGGALPTELGNNAQNAYMNAYNQQLQGLASFSQTPLNTNAIAGTMSGIGSTYAQGLTASGQAQQAGYQGVSNSIGQGLNMYASTYRSPVL